LAQPCGNVVVHLIFSTKSRRPLVTREIRADLLAYLGGIIREMGGTALIINGTSDHVHMLARTRPDPLVGGNRPGDQDKFVKMAAPKGHVEFAWQA